MIQALVNFLYRYPKSQIKRFNKFGGYFNYLRMLKGQREMKHASLGLKPVISNPEGLSVHFLTGKKFLHQTLFCIQSLSNVTKRQFQFILIDDGSFDTQIINQIKYLLPGAEIITRGIIEKNLQKSLPNHLYPFLHHKRKVYPHIKKLTDIHTLQSKGWKLVIDSDMLFWKEPQDLIVWLQKPNSPLHMVDCTESYGYSKKLMEELCRTPIPFLVNVGVIGLNSEQINWNQLERWAKELEDSEGTTYFLEQALTAMLIGNTPATILSRSEYIVNPSENSINNKAGILHHYVDLSKEGYFKKAWKTI